MGTFQSEYVPANGDIIYGKSKARTQYQQYMTAEQLTFVNTDWPYFDNYNDAFGISKPQVYQDDSPDTLEKNILGATHGKERAKDLPATQLKSRLSPTSVFDKTRTPVDRLQREKKDTVNLKGVSKPRPEPDALASARYMLALRRACKFGIGFVATDPAFLTHGAKIRFLLDGLDMKKMATKEPLDRKAEVTRDLGSLGKETIDSMYVPITTSELRYICRHWGQLEKLIAFYVAGNAVKAPWEEEYLVTDCFSRQLAACKSDWETYLSTRSNKLTRHADLL